MAQSFDIIQENCLRCFNSSIAEYVPFVTLPSHKFQFNIFTRFNLLGVRRIESVEQIIDAI